MSLPAELKKELVLSFKFRRIGTVWKPINDKPEVLRLSNQDCSRAYADPVLIWSQSRTTVEARIHDEMGIDIANAGSFLGDWTGAKCRCEELLAITPQPTDAAA
jgi:hypothetical protein